MKRFWEYAQRDVALLMCIAIVLHYFRMFAYVHGLVPDHKWHKLWMLMQSPSNQWTDSQVHFCGIDVTQPIQSFCNFTASVAGFTMHAFNNQICVHNNLIYNASLHKGVVVAPECTCLFHLSTFLITTMCLRGAWRNKFCFAAAGSMVLFLYSVVRADVLFYISLYAPKYFDFAHETCSNVCITVLLFTMLLFWDRFNFKKEMK